jgi:phosphatidylinositol-3,4,5-trisphosphate 3-phosphatase and dual-specificity protein phosphatase PTEN
VYNFCCEPGRGYDPALFDGRVERYPFLDHHTPSLKRMVEFADSAYEWILQDKKNVVTMHCKAGKGRAGLMGCILLFRAGHVASALEAMAKYNATRVDDMKGILLHCTSTNHPTFISKNFT